MSLLFEQSLKKNQRSAFYCFSTVSAQCGFYLLALVSTTQVLVNEWIEFSHFIL